MAKKRVRLSDIAEKVGVSRMAVSHVLLGTATGRISVGDEKAVRIRAVAKEMGYVPNRAAQMMHGANSRLIGVLYDSTHLGFGLSRLDRNLNRIAQKNGYSIISAITGYESELQERAISEFLSLRTDGVFCMAQDPHVRWGGYGKLLDPFPHVAVLGNGGTPAWLAKPYPFAELSRLAVDHLVESGKRNLALVILDQVFTSSIERKQGFLERIRHHGVEANSIVVEPKSKHGNGRLAMAESVLQELRSNDVDGIIAHNDQLASALLSVARRANVPVPNQLGIIGLDNEPFCQTLLPSLTSIDMNWGEVAGGLFQRLIDSIEAPPPAEELPATPLLIQRESTTGQ